MKRSRLLLAALLLALPAGAEELSADVVARVKAATVFVKLPFGTGSGFLFKRSGSTGFLITCAHVVGRSDTAEVVFNSGNKDERSCKAAVIAVDPDRDLACLVLKGASDLPAALEIGTQTGVRETENVFVAGFPFGEMLSAANRNPEISLTQVTVSSLRKDEKGDVAVVQLSGDVNPGNSGGPAVDGKGRVVGVAQSKITAGQTCFFVPPEGIREFLRGRITGIAFEPVSRTARVAKVKVVLSVSDPLATLQSVGMAYVRQHEIDALPEPPKEGPDGKWHRAHPAMKELTFKLSEDRTSAEAVLEMERGAKDAASIPLCFQSCFTRSDGSTVWTQPGVQDLAFEEGQAAASEKPPKDDPVAAGPGLEVADSLEVLATLTLRSVVSDLFLSPDGAFLYALDLSDGKVLKLEAGTLKVLKEAPAPDGAVAMSMSPDGNRLYVAAARPGITSYSPDQKELGTIQCLGAKELSVLSTFPIDPAPMDIEATDKGLLVVGACSQWNGLVVVDADKKAVSGGCHSVYGGACVRLHPDQTRAYTGDRGLSPADFRCVPLRKDPKTGYGSYDSPYHGEHPLGGSFEISPDGCFLVGSGGPVLRLSRTQQADLRYLSSIDRFLCAAMAKGCGTLLTTNAEGFLKVYDMGSFELRKSVKTGMLCSRLALDPKRRILYAVAGALPDAQQGQYRHPSTPALGNIVAFSLAGKIP